MSVAAMLLAGGQGSRLSILSQRRAKPAVPFGGSYRIIDFTLSNVMHSEIPYVGVLTQYKPHSLSEHIGLGEWWGFTGRDRMARVLPPYTGEDDSDWYAGTADAIWQNRQFIQRVDPEMVLVLSGDHIYNMNYADMLRTHKANKADVTIAMQEVPWEDTSRFGVVEMGENGRIKSFQEKPKSNPISNLASLGIYVFDADVLLRRLQEDSTDGKSNHDFGKNIMPAMLAQDRVYGHVFAGYWRDVGTIQSYWETNMEALDPASGLDLASWNLRTNYFDAQVANYMPAHLARSARVQNSYVASGCIVEGEVHNSILFPGVRVGRGSKITGSILMNDSTIGPDCVLDRIIADKDSRIGRSSQIGCGDAIVNIEYPTILDTGITVIGKGASLPDGTSAGRNVLIFPDVAAADLSSSVIASGTTIAPSSERRNILG